MLGLNLQFSSISAAALDWFYVRWRKANEIGRSLHFNAQINAHPRQPNPIHFDLVFSTPRDNKRMNPVHLPRQTLPREHFKLHPYTLCVPARLVCSNGRRRQCIAKPNSTASRNSQRCGVWASLCALRVGVYNEIWKTAVFPLFSHLNLKWDFPKCSFLEEYHSLRKRKLLRAFFKSFRKI